MTQAELDAMKAAFAAKGGTVTQAGEGVAFGVNAEADKLKRKQAREARRFEQIEHASENYVQRVREAAHVGGRRAALEVLQGERYRDHTHD